MNTDKDYKSVLYVEHVDLLTTLQLIEVVNAKPNKAMKKAAKLMAKRFHTVEMKVMCDQIIKSTLPTGWLSKQLHIVERRCLSSEISFNEYFEIGATIDGQIN